MSIFEYWLKIITSSENEILNKKVLLANTQNKKHN